jgi:hypothetical protein
MVTHFAIVSADDIWPYVDFTAMHVSSADIGHFIAPLTERIEYWITPISPTVATCLRPIIPAGHI